MGNFIHTIEDVPTDKKLIVFDMDGTLTESKMPIDSEMAVLLAGLLKKKKVGIVGGGAFERFETQVVAGLPRDANLENLFVLPLNGGSFYQYKNGGWQNVYSLQLSAEEKEKVREAFKKIFAGIGYVPPERIYGEQIEDRGSQITFSALGQNAPLDEKTEWSQQHDSDRLNMALRLQNHLPDMEVRVAGLTSIDITRKGIDKKFAIEKLAEYLKISVQDTLFVGDAFEPDGNDSPALESGAECFRIGSVQDTKDLINHIN